MAVTVRIPTQLRELSGGASEVTADGGTVAEVLDAARRRAPGLRRAALRRAGRAAPLRQRVRRRRGHPLPRRRRHPGRRRPDRQHRPRRRRRLAADAAARTSERRSCAAAMTGATLRRSERARQAGDRRRSSWASLRGTVCSPASLVDLHARRCRVLDHDGVGAGDEVRRRRGTASASSSISTFSLMRRTTTGPGCELRERRGRRTLDLVRSTPGSGCRAGRSPGSPSSSDELLLDVGRDRVLPAVGLLVDLLPLEPDHVDEQPLGEAVAAHDRVGDLAALGR